MSDRIGNHTKARRQLEQLKLIGMRMINNRKVYTCDKCDLEFTSTNSVVRHQEKSCLRVRVISLPPSALNAKDERTTRKKCPICSSTFYNTHRLSIHIYKHHRNLLGSASQSPTLEAKRRYEKQLAKLKAKTVDAQDDDDDDNDDGDDEAENENRTDDNTDHDEDDEHDDHDEKEDKVCHVFGNSKNFKIYLFIYFC